MFPWAPPDRKHGRLAGAVPRYEAASGTKLDWHILAFHTVAFLVEAYYGPLIGLHDQEPGGDWVESYVQVAVIGRRALEALAELEDIALDEISLPPAEQTPLEDLALTRLEAEITRLPAHSADAGLAAQHPRLLAADAAADRALPRLA